MISYLLFACFIGLALAQDFKPYNLTALNLFHNSDFNGNGQFDRSELNDVFQNYDVNYDGRVARHEYLHFISEPLYNFAVILFEDYDCAPPPDGFIDDTDFDVYYKIMDENQDDMVTSDEFVNHWIRVLERNEALHSPTQTTSTP
ncbi:visinin-like protein 1 [Argopecten irradians]|uniref:visinin-like protein 1 n=1 Tax=Argopecten irradians TaxID=31199 RepID=UPI003720BCF0